MDSAWSEFLHHFFEEIQWPMLEGVESPRLNKTPVEMVIGWGIKGDIPDPTSRQRGCSNQVTKQSPEDLRKMILFLPLATCYLGVLVLPRESRELLSRETFWGVTFEEMRWSFTLLHSMCLWVKCTPTVVIVSAKSTYDSLAPAWWWLKFHPLQSDSSCLRMISS